MKKLFSLPVSAAAVLIVLGAMVMTGWVVRDAAMVQVNADSVGMTFGAALGFASVGLALFLPTIRPRWAVKAPTVIGWGLIAMASAILLAYLGDFALFIDFPHLHSWLNDGNPRPGRMAPNTGAGFLLCGTVLLLMPRVRSRRAGIAIQAATFIVLMLGLIGLSSYFLRLDLIYAWVPAVRMAIQTGAGMMIAGLGLWSSWRHAEWYRTQRYFRDDEKAGYVGATILTVIALTAGVVGFAVQQATLERAFSQSLLAQMKSRIMLFRNVVGQGIEHAENAARQPGLVRQVGVLNGRPRDAEATDQLQIIVQDMLASGIAGIAIYDRSEREIARFGHFTNEPGIEADLGLPTPASLVWDETLYLRTRSRLQNKGEAVGSIVIQQPLPLIAEQFADTEGLGVTGEMGMCIPRLDVLSCFPQGRNPDVHSFARRGVNGKLTPMGYAVDGQSGIFKGLDYRGHNVIAAYGPLSGTGLGMVVKQDSVELYQPIREQLHWYGLLLLVLAAGGAMLLRSQVAPMVAKLLRSEHAAKESETRFREIMETLGEGVFVVDRQANIIFSNPAAQRLLGWTEQELQGQHGHTLLHHTRMDGAPYPAASCEIGKVVNSGQDFRAYDEAFWRKDGSMLPVSVHAAPMIRNGEVVGAVVAFHDITERKKAADQAHHLAHFDILTDLPNRALLTDRLQQALTRAKRNPDKIALLFVDLDKFKPVNDTLGHHIGDLLLQAVARRLQDCLRESDTVARVGGDEFVVLLPNIETEQGAMAVAEKILHALNQPFALEGHEVHISGSIGVAVHPEHGADQEQLVRSADRAMYHAKEGGGAAIFSFGQLEPALS